MALSVLFYLHAIDQGAAWMRNVNTWKTADLLLREYGSEARSVAASLANIALHAGEGPRCVLWIRVERALSEFSAEKPHDGERMN